MSTGPALVLLLVPYAVLSLSWVWPAYLRPGATVLRRSARLLPPTLTALLVGGEFWNGGWRADGFDGRLFAAGVAAMAVLHLVVFVRPVRDRLAAWAVRAHEAVREDFQEPPGAPPRPHRLGSTVLFVVFCGLFYVAYTTYGLFNYQLKYFVYDFLDLVQNTARDVPFLDVLTGERCASTRLYRTFPLTLLAFADSLTPARYYHVCVALVGCIFAVQWSLNRHRSPWVLFASHLFYLAVSLDADLEYNRTGYFELAFALLYLVGFLVILHARWTARWAVASGFVTGVAFLQKELAILLVALVAYRLATSGLPCRRIGGLALRWAAAFTLPMGILATLLLRCGATEGVYHLPVVWFRGVVLQTEWTHLDVKTAIDQGQAFSVAEMVLRRLSFQTVGEVVVGALAWFGRYTMLGVFPVAYLIANLPAAHVRIIGVYLVLGFFLYGVTHWKGGDSSDPLYTMLPFGYVFAAPYLVRLVSRSVAVLRPPVRWSARNLYAPVLLAVNLWFLGYLAAPVLHTVRDLRHLAGVSASGLRFEVEPEGREADLRDLVVRLRDQDEIGRWLFIASCPPHKVPRSLVHSDLDRNLTLLDVRFEILAALRNMDVSRIRQAFRIMTHLLKYRLEGTRRLYVLACTPDRPPDRPSEPFVAPGPWLGGCVETLYADRDEQNIVLFSFNLERCRRYLPDDLVGRGLDIRYVPRLPVTPEP